MSRLFRPVVPFLALLAVTALVGISVDAQDKDKKVDVKDKKDAPKDKVDVKDKKDAPKDKDTPKDKVEVKDKKEEVKDKKEETKKEEPKKEPFVADPALIELKGHNGSVSRIAYLPGGKLLVSVGRDRTVRIWDLAAKKESQIVKDLPQDAKALAVGDGKIFVGTGKWNKDLKIAVDPKDVKDKKDAKEGPKGGWEGEIRILDLAGKTIGSLKGHSETIESLSLSKDGKIIASASEDATAKLWDIAGMKEGIGFKGHTKPILAVALSPDGKKAATASDDGSVKIWDIADGKDLATIKSEVVETKVDPKTKKEDKKTVPGRAFTSLAFSPDGKTLVAGNLDGEIRFIDVDAGKDVASQKAHGGVWAIAFSPDGQKIATGGWDQLIKIWDPAGKELATIKAHDRTVTALAFSPDNQFLASGGFDQLIKIWPTTKK